MATPLETTTKSPSVVLSRRTALSVVSAGVLLLPAGTALAADPSPSGSDRARSVVASESPDPTHPTVSPPASPGSELELLQLQIDELASENSGLVAERDELLDVVTQFGEFYDPMEADRLLLGELRKELPMTRPEAEAYLARMQRLALVSDPVRLGPIADRVLEASPIFFDWRDREFATPEEATRAFVESGAGGFNTTFQDFRNAILLTTANRLDTLLSLLDRAQ